MMSPITDRLISVPLAALPAGEASDTIAASVSGETQNDLHAKYPAKTAEKNTRMNLKGHIGQRTCYFSGCGGFPGDRTYRKMNENEKCVGGAVGFLKQSCGTVSNANAFGRILCIFWGSQ
ncbi:hypothetical protein Nepgr_010080 [Nepenthes gracilis]|uniref:Uncharacterized protein n=1 Tax=Nepenthes gracilis TaxID=150966 RepID=A0AAD3SBS6_NEPGR|nr:hypothetical protein Nepgr_010080 [Nepenthes gracilis]